MAALLALGSALGYGIADFVGGLLARRADPMMIALIGQAGALVLTAGAAPLVPAGDVQLQDLGFGAVSGVGTGIDTRLRYTPVVRKWTLWCQGCVSLVVALVGLGSMCPARISASRVGTRASRALVVAACRTRVARLPDRRSRPAAAREPFARTRRRPGRAAP